MVEGKKMQKRNRCARYSYERKKCEHLGVKESVRNIRETDVEYIRAITN